MYCGKPAATIENSLCYKIKIETTKIYFVVFLAVPEKVRTPPVEDIGYPRGVGYPGCVTNYPGGLDIKICRYPERSMTQKKGISSTGGCCIP